MATPRKTIIAALHATDLRGQVLPARVPTECLLIIRDGEPVEPVVTRSPLRYHYRHRPEITLTKGAFFLLCQECIH